MVSFGGSQDEDEDDEINSEIQDDMNFYDTKTQRWFPAVVKGKYFDYTCFQYPVQRKRKLIVDSGRDLE